MQIARLLPALLILAAITAAFAAGRSMAPQDDDQPEPPKTFEVFEGKDLLAARAEKKAAWLPFLTRSSLYCGIYHLTKGGSDGQSPHGHDEVYHVLSGKGKFTAGEETVDVTPGQVLFVAAKVEHRFHDIEEDLDLLVFFSTARPMTAEDEDR